MRSVTLLLFVVALCIAQSCANKCIGDECYPDEAAEIGDILPTKGTLTTVTGKKVEGAQDGPAEKARFNNPTGLVTKDGFLYIADSENGKIRKMNIETGEVTTFAGSGSSGCKDGVGSEATFTLPNALLFAPNGDLLVGTYSQVRRITPEGIVSTVVGKCRTRDLTGSKNRAGFWKISGMALDNSTGILYVSDSLNHKIKQISPEGKVSVLAGNMFGFKEGRGTNVDFYGPSGLLFHPSGVLLVADSLNHRIRRITTDGLVSTFAGNGEKESKDGRSRVASFYSPVDLDLDADGSVVVLDGWGAKIRRISNGVVTTLEWTSEDGKTVSEIPTSPASITIHEGNHVYFVADSHSIKKLVL